jgi:hypothetical protein
VTPSTCDGRASAFDDALAAASAGTCASDADCKCFPGGVSAKHGCGGVTDAKTSERLTKLASEFEDAGCHAGVACAAWMCTPSCQAGKCTNGPPPKITPAAGGVSCESRIAEIDRVLASATRKCTTDKDCACFRGGISKTSPCGDITDARTNERFEALAKEWSAAGCKKEQDVMCPAMLCEATCNAGACGPRQIIQ